VLGFPCNQFGAQEPGTDDEILEFVTSKYDVSFPMFSKIDVNGEGACDLYRWLRDETGGADIAWNFEKFIVDREGKVIDRLSPIVTPEEIQARMSELL